MITTITCGKCGKSNDFDSKDFKGYPVNPKKGVYRVTYKVHCGICGVLCEQSSRR